MKVIYILLSVLLTFSILGSTNILDPHNEKGTSAIAKFKRSPLDFAITNTDPKKRKRNAMWKLKKRAAVGRRK
ncbi:hypothetical protein Glove_144g22 [Diversispora epigaea]|uniref:Uncharacterized protein n=1 Tax=Diversispora epigaea TaxID=1348612 RepID=A0A397IU87_9GLOM|nr:hypothetical protein Glove_144g22 [Diversispora epigaea]